MWQEHELCRARLRHARLTTMLVVAFSILLGACGEPPAAPTPPAVYTVDGEIVRLPDPERSPNEVLIRHEAVPTFANAEGEVIGMKAMAMPFPLADPALLEGIEAGDRVELTFEVRWDTGAPLLLTALQELAPAEAPPAEEPPAEVGGTQEGEG